MPNTFELLVTTMNKNEYEILEMLNAMGAFCDVIVRCQNKEINSLKSFTINDNKVTVVWATDIGLSKNRNELLKLATADIVLFADDDEKFSPNFVEEILNRFNQNIDYIDFSLEISVKEKILLKEGSKGKLRNRNRIGVLNMPIKRSILIEKEIFFDERFGAGCEIDRGEDTIFRRDVIRKKLKHISSSFILLNLYTNSRPSNCASLDSEKAFKSRCVFYGYFYNFYILFLLKLYFSQTNGKKYGFKKAIKYAKIGKRMRHEQ
mgnify:CR=1 FL=1